MIFSSLTPTQQDQAAYLFADEIFGTDASAFDYEVQDNNVIGRTKLNANSQQLSVRKPHTVLVNVSVREVPAEFVTIEMDRQSAYAIQSIARSVVARLIQSQSVEA